MRNSSLVLRFMLITCELSVITQVISHAFFLCRHPHISRGSRIKCYIIPSRVWVFLLWCFLVFGCLFFLTVALPFKQCLPILYFLLQQHWCFNFMSIFQLWSDSGLEDWWISLLCFHWVWKGMFFRFTVCRFCLWKFIFGILPLRKNTEILKHGVANFSLTGLVIQVVGPKWGKHLSLFSQATQICTS